MQSSQSKKEEFQKYLEKSGVTDALTKVLATLFETEERPGNAIEFVREYLGTSGGVDVNELHQTIEKQKTEIELLKKEISDLKKE